MKLQIEPTPSGGDAFRIEVWSDDGKLWMFDLETAPVCASDDEIRAANREIVKIVNAAPDLLAACEPFAALDSKLRNEWTDDRPLWELDGTRITVGDVRRAASAVAKTRGEEEKSDGD